MLPTPRREAEVSAGPEAPRGSGVPTVLSPPPPSSRVRGDNPPRIPGSQRARGARRGWGWPACAAPSGRARVRVPSGSGRKGVARQGRRGAPASQRGARRGRGVLAGGRGRGRAVTGQRRKEGVTPISAARAPLPPAGSDGGRRAGAPWAWASEPLAGAQAERSVGGPGDRTGSSSCAPASTS